MLSKRIAAIIFVCVVIIAYMYSHKSPHQPKSETFTVATQKNITHLYYNGAIKPIREELIISPANGIVKKINFHYGDFVNKGQALLELHSPDLENDVKEAMSNFLRAKQAYLNSQKSMQGTEELHKEKIISEQEFYNEQSQYQNSLLAYLEANNKLKQILSNVPAAQQQMLNLSLARMNDVKGLLQQQFQDLTIYAKQQGIILFPEKNEHDSGELLQVGHEVKKDDTLLVVGDLSGVAITCDVTEMDINHLKSGRDVVITFSAQPSLQLRGIIVSVAKQAKSSDNSSFSSFPVTIHVPKLLPEQIQKIRVGMSAKIDISVIEPPAIKIPIKAVFQKAGHSYVTKVDAYHRKRDVEVETGTTSLTDVTILRGLKDNDRVLVHD